MSRVLDIKLKDAAKREEHVRTKLEKKERYKNFKAWVDESFVNKAIFVASLLAVAIVLFVLIPSGIKLIEKTQLIKSQTVYFSKEGTRYHLYDDCSNMSDPRETFERTAKNNGLERCSKCYAGVMNFHGHFWYADDWEFFLFGLAFILTLIFAVLLKTSKWIQEKTAKLNKENGLFVFLIIILVVLAIAIIATAIYWYG